MTDDLTSLAEARQRAYARERALIVRSRGYLCSGIEHITGRPRGLILHLIELGLYAPDRHATISVVIPGPWRIESDQTILAGSLDPSEEGIEAARSRIVGEQVVDVIVASPTMDLSITFSSGLVLHAFIDEHTIHVNTDVGRYYTQWFVVEYPGPWR
jgi:hypothetical protein